DESVCECVCVCVCVCVCTCWLGGGKRSEVMWLAYWAISFLMDFSTAGGMRPETLVMMSCSSSRGSEGSLSVFFSRSTHSLSCETTHTHTHIHSSRAVIETSYENL